MTTSISSLPSLPRIFGQYEIEQRIGRGESSRVFLAHHIRIREHKVALKVLLSQNRRGFNALNKRRALPLASAIPIFHA